MTVLLLVLAYLCAASSVVGAALGHAPIWVAALVAALVLGAASVAVDAFPRRRPPKATAILCRGTECRRPGYEDRQEVSDDAERTSSPGDHQAPPRSVRVDEEVGHGPGHGGAHRQRRQVEGRAQQDGAEGSSDAQGVVGEWPDWLRGFSLW